MAADWGASLERLFAKKGVEELKTSKAVKKVVKAAAQHSNRSAQELSRQLEEFLRRGDGGFRLAGSKIARAPLPAQKLKKKKEKEKKKKKAKVSGETAAAADEEHEAPAAGAAAAAAGAGPAKKKRKQQHGAEGSAAAEQQLEAGTAPAHGEPEQKKKEKKKKRKAGEGPEQQEEPQEQQQQEQQEEEEPQSRKKKKRKTQGDGKGAAAAAAAAPRGWEDEQDGAGVHGVESGDKERDTAGMPWRQNNSRKKVKSGAFSKAEKDAIKRAVEAYAVANGRSTDDYSWLYGSSRRGETKGLWSKIAAALPHRTVKSVWAAGSRLFHEGNYQGRWSSEEDAQLLQLVSEKGRRWKEIGGALGRMPETCRDRWLMVRLGEDRKRGRWEEDETERLRQAVHDYLAAKVAAEGQAGGEGEVTLSMADITGAVAEPVVDEDGAAAFTVSRRVVLDDIDWSVVSAAVGTRTNIQCLEKWYSQLSPSMVARGEWGSGDDRRLLRALYLSGAAHDYELDWSSLVRGRTAAQARRRWRLMLKVVPDHRDREFEELVEVLVDRYLPQLKERRRQSAGEGDAGERGSGGQQQEEAEVEVVEDEEG
ncbi:hypothetical protein CHLNCDRAFT_49822 [Chlorella variabilis]|uniref:Uncharacterized protein n=1 Tax=Chlorella variabilis TaxID=554065 RepID=E1Z482_CHLVA|nr:hypothetical protein CHLNCDRAFT_49822 [Chlorella variabilis]EFN59006.1 hypothetical protein CHLNCDRAFT_49822 [Chlorella variabilis]|eukprot:XP_005851108.1 hypothetical protein CHLNCDRAFT_49822 [Chlorella variabilis]